jgi:hypothetical protein
MEDDGSEEEITEQQFRIAQKELADADEILARAIDAERIAYTPALATAASVVFDALLETNRLKNAAVKAVAMEYGTREEPNEEFGTKTVQNMRTVDVLSRIDDDDNVVIVEADAGRRAAALAKIDARSRSRVKFESLAEFLSGNVR